MNEEVAYLGAASRGSDWEPNSTLKHDDEEGDLVLIFPSIAEQIT